MELSGIFLMFLLGLRHGFDPDHIAVIDGIGVRLNEHKPLLAKWAGTFFAAGHGSVVTCIAVMISRFSHSWSFPKQVWDVLDWLPGLILIVVGLLNLRMITRSQFYRPAGLKFAFIPDKLKNSSNPLAIISIGILFAMVFDTNTQAAAWAYTATSQLSTLNAVILGFAFSLGMITTDTVDSRILFTLLQKSSGKNELLNYRRKLGWIIIFVSLTVGIYKISIHLIPVLEIPENTLTWVGIMFFTCMVIFYAFISFNNIQSSKNNTDGN